MLCNHCHSHVWICKAQIHAGKSDTTQCLQPRRSRDVLGPREHVSGVYRCDPADKSWIHCLFCCPGMVGVGLRAQNPRDVSLPAGFQPAEELGGVLGLLSEELWEAWAAGAGEGWMDGLGCHTSRQDRIPRGGIERGGPLAGTGEQRALSRAIFPMCAFPFAHFRHEVMC